MSEETTRRRHLGRGLSALFGEEAEAPGRPPGAGPIAMPIEFLGPGPRQPRRVFDAAGMVELVASVRERGILQPLIVRPDPAETGRYEIVAGERRWRAAQRAQLHEVPVIVRELDDREALEVALIENIQRRDLTPIEEAEGLIRLMDEFGYTQKALAEAVGKSRGHVANMLRLLQPRRGADAAGRGGAERRPRPRAGGRREPGDARRGGRAPRAQRAPDRTAGPAGARRRVAAPAPGAPAARPRDRRAGGRSDAGSGSAGRHQDARRRRRAGDPLRAARTARARTRPPESRLAINTSRK